MYKLIDLKKVIKSTEPIIDKAVSDATLEVRLKNMSHIEFGRSESIIRKLSSDLDGVIVEDDIPLVLNGIAFFSSNYSISTGLKGLNVMTRPIIIAYINNIISKGGFFDSPELNLQVSNRISLIQNLASDVSGFSTLSPNYYKMLFPSDKKKVSYSYLFSGFPFGGPTQVAKQVALYGRPEDALALVSDKIYSLISSSYIAALPDRMTLYAEVYMMNNILADIIPSDARLLLRQAFSEALKKDPSIRSVSKLQLNWTHELYKSHLEDETRAVNIKNYLTKKRFFKHQNLYFG